MSGRDWDEHLPPHTLKPDEQEGFTNEVIHRWQAERATQSMRHRMWGLAAAIAATMLVVVSANLVLSRNQPIPSGPVATPLAYPSSGQTMHLSDDRIVASAKAMYTVTGDHGDRIVDLKQGEVHCEVTHREPGERFRVHVGDTQIEVTGTVFSVEADHNALTSLHVETGQVVLRHADAVTIVNAGETWPSLTQPRSSLTPTGTSNQSAIESPHVRTNTWVERSIPDGRIGMYLQHGLTHLDLGDTEAAIRAFTSEQRFPHLREDAHFYEAIALRMGGHRLASAAVMDAFLTTYPTSTYAAEMHCLRGKLSLEIADKARAKSEFEAAAQSTSTQARACGETGLAAL